MSAGLLLGIVASSQSVASDMVLIETQTVGSGGTSAIVFSNIPQTYRTLRVSVVGRFTGAYTSADAFVRLNGDSGSNYVNHAFVSNNSGTSTAYAYTAQSASWVTGFPGAASADGNAFGGGVFEITDYRSGKLKMLRGLLHANDGSTTATYTGLSSSLWMNTAAVTSITITGPSNIAQYSSATLYGFKD